MTQTWDIYPDVSDFEHHTYAGGLRIYSPPIQIIPDKGFTTKETPTVLVGTNRQEMELPQQVVQPSYQCTTRPSNPIAGSHWMLGYKIEGKINYGKGKF